jgi:hypothetical protein
VPYSGRARTAGPPRFSGDAQLPLLLGDLAMLLLEPLPAVSRGGGVAHGVHDGSKSGRVMTGRACRPGPREEER